MVFFGWSSGRKLVVMDLIRQKCWGSTDFIQQGLPAFFAPSMQTVVPAEPD